jgi:hypothetical protein
MREYRKIPGHSKRYSSVEVEIERLKPLSERCLTAIEFVAKLIPDSTDWLVIKKRILLELPVHDRQLFSTRDPISKKHYPFSEFERRVRDKWFELTGNVLLMPESKMMDGVDTKLYL